MEKDLNLIGTYLARRDADSLTSADLLLLTGSCLFQPIQLAADALKQGLVKQVLISGGIGHSTQYLRNNVVNHPEYQTVATDDRAEADIIYDILVNFLDLDPAQLIVENQSTNCGANAEESKKVADCLNLKASSLLLIQDPTMQRRTHASCERFWKGTEVVSYSPFVPVVHEEKPGKFVVEGEGGGVWGFDRFLSLAVGEIVRLRDDENGYGPKGKNFIDHVDVPAEVLAAYERVSSHFNESNRV